MMVVKVLMMKKVFVKMMVVKFHMIQVLVVVKVLMMMKKVFVKMIVMMILKFYLMYNSIFHLVDLFPKIDRSDEQKCQPSFFER
jgi:hypothetical protein